VQELPVIDIEGWNAQGEGAESVAAEIGRACREWGFFHIVGHGVDETLSTGLQEAASRFFALPPEQKHAISMDRGGRAWRGYFPTGGELTSGQPDLKEGIYFGAELDDDHASVQAGLPMHGRNLFPDGIPGFRDLVLDYMAEMTRVGHVLMETLAIGLGLQPSYFDDRYTRDPLTLFRIFHYLPASSAAGERSDWGVGEHTDYGVLTILRQDETAGLQVKAKGRWIDVPPLPGSLVCNIGDMLDRLTGGRYRSTPHRVRKPEGRSRLSFPFFFDPNFNAEIEPIDPQAITVDDAEQRWDQSSVHDFHGTYGEYLLGKVSAVFPQLGRDVL
jgi:isopenicillin N synthase-like dioxygenase